ncbi:MAG: VCBS repeat-containing protein [Kofleriaceae bacterium]
MRRSTRSPVARLSLPTRALAAGLAVALFSSPLGATTVCPQTSPVAGWSGTTLDTGTVKNGVVYDGSGARLQLQNGAGQFKSTSLGITDHTVFAAVADFDRDGWDDFVGADEPGNYLRIYKNRTFDNPEPDWSDVNAVRTPKFVCGATDPCRLISPEGTNSTSIVKRRPTVAADFNGDGWPDVVTFSADVTGTYTEVFNSGKVYLNKGINNAGYPTWKSSYNALASDTTFTNVGQQPWGGTTIKAVDYNGDRKLDIMISSGDSGGTIRVLLNNCTASTSSPPAPAPLLCRDGSQKFTQTGAGVIPRPRWGWARRAPPATRCSTLPTSTATASRTWSRGPRVAAPPRPTGCGCGRASRAAGSPRPRSRSPTRAAPRWCSSTTSPATASPISSSAPTTGTTTPAMAATPTTGRTTARRRRSRPRPSSSPPTTT